MSDGEPLSWRCFYCDEAEARLHFGDLTLHSMPISDPACGVSLEQFREMEHELARYRIEDSDKDREIQGLLADHQRHLRREEESGYEKGLRDAWDEASWGTILKAAFRRLFPVERVSQPER